MAVDPKGPGLALRVVAVCAVIVWLAGCGVVAVVDGAATLTGQAVKTTSKAAGMATRATLGGVRAAGRLATRPLRKNGHPERQQQ